MADTVSIEEDIDDDMKTTFESGPAPDIWSWRLQEGKERYLPHLRRRDRLYLVKHPQPVISLGLETRLESSEQNNLVTSSQ